MFNAILLIILSPFILAVSALVIGTAVFLSLHLLLDVIVAALAMI